MKRGKEFNDVLDECLERLLAKGETVEQCLESYPEHAAELEPLLKTAVAANRALAIEPDPEFKARAGYQFRSILQKVKPKRPLPVLGWQPRWAMVMVVFLVVVLAGAGTVVAADSSMPGNPLYPVKLATEQVRLTLTPSDIGKAELYATLADRRMAEIAYMVNRGRPQYVERTAQRLNAYQTQIAVLAATEKATRDVAMATAIEEAPAVREAPGQARRAQESMAARHRGERLAKLRVIVVRHAINHPARLRALLERAPESVKPALQRAITISVASYQKALEDLD